MLKRRRATLKDVAESVGVHVSTVSRALNPETRHLITSDIVRKIAAASRALGYIPNTAAYSLRTTRTKIVGVVVPDITNSIFPPIIRGVEDALMEHGYATVLVNTDGGVEREASMIEALAARGVDGLVVASVHRDDGRIRDLATQGTPVITVNRRMDDPSIPSVTSDEEDGVRRMLTHLAALGHRRICAIAGDQTISTGQRRHDAFSHIAPDLGIEVDPSGIVFAGDFNESAGERCMEELLARGIEFTAVHCSNDRLAIGAISALRRRGLVCPTDVSVTGFNDMPMVDRIDPPLTTIRIQQHKVGYVAAELLYEQMRELSSRPVPQHVVLPVELVIRSSTAPPQHMAGKASRRTVKDRG